MGQIIPPDPPGPPTPPEECGYWPVYDATYGFHAEFDVCEAWGCDTLCGDWIGGIVILHDSNCESCPYAFYSYVSCSCKWYPYPVDWVNFDCHFVFFGCSDDPGTQPSPPDPSSAEAFVLGIAFGFLPAVKCHATGGHQVVDGKFEPDHFPTAAIRDMVLAHWYDHTNVIVQYDPDLNIVAQYHVSGTLAPGSAADYYLGGEFNDLPSYASSGRTFVIWWDGIDSWIINEQWSGPENPHWKRTDPSIVGDYAPQCGATGTATVAAGPL